MAEKRGALVQVIDSVKVGEGVETTLLFEEMPFASIAPGLVQIGTGSPGLLFELHRLVKRLGNSLTFITYDVDDSPLVAGESYTFYSQWAPYQLELAQDNGRQWCRRTFENQDMIVFNLAGGGTIGRKIVEGEDTEEGSVIRDGWEHEHCELCFETISAAEGYQHEGFTDGEAWICRACYEKYIVSGFGKKLGDAA